MDDNLDQVAEVAPTDQQTDQVEQQGPPTKFKVSQQVLSDFSATVTAKPDLTPAQLLSKFPEFKNNPKILQAAMDYSATSQSGKYKTVDELNSKFPEFDLTPQKKSSVVTSTPPQSGPVPGTSPSTASTNPLAAVQRPQPAAFDPNTFMQQSRAAVLANKPAQDNISAQEKAPAQAIAKRNWDVNHVADAKAKKEFKAKAIDNATKKALMVKGIPAQPGSLQYNDQKAKLEQQVADGNATISATAEGEPGLKRVTGFFENLKNGWNAATQSDDEADAFANQMTTQQRIDYVNKHPDVEAPDAYIGTRSSFLGSSGNFIGSAAPFLAKAAAGAALGTVAIAAAPESAGASLAGLPVAASFLLTAPDMVNHGITQEVIRQYNILKKQYPDRSDTENMEEAQLKGTIIGGSLGIAENAAFMGTSMKNLVVPEGKTVVGNAIKRVVDSGVHLGAISSGTTAATQELANAAGVHTDQFDIAKNSSEAFGSGLTTGMLLTATFHAPNLVKSAAKYALLKTTTPEIIRNVVQANENVGTVPKGTTASTMADLKGYSDAMNKLPEGLNPDAQASLAGLIQKRDNLTAEMKSKDPSFKKFYQEKLDAISVQMSNIISTGEPYKFEIDEATGQPYEKGAEPIVADKAESAIKKPIVADVLDSDVMLNGERGRLRTDEENNVVFSKDGKDTQLGKTTDEKFANSDIADHEITEVPKVEVQGNTVKIDDIPFEIVSFNKDGNGDLASVSLKDASGKEITKRDKDLAMDIAVAKNNHDFENRPEPKDYESEVSQPIKDNFKQEHGQTADDVINSMPEEVADTFAAMDNGIVALAPHEQQKMVVRASEWADEARQKITEGNDAPKEKAAAIKMLDKFDKDLNKHYGKLEKQRQGQANADVKREQATSLAAAKQAARDARAKTKQTELDLREQDDLATADQSRKKLYKAVADIEQPQDAHGIAMHYFAGGNKIGEMAMTEHTGTRKSYSNRSGKVSDTKGNDLFVKDGETVSQLQHKLWEGLPEEVRSSVSDSEIGDAIRDVISSHTGREDVARKFLESSPEFMESKRAKEEMEHWAEYDRQNKQAIDDELAFMQDKANEEAEIKGDPDYVKRIINQYETENAKGKVSSTIPNGNVGGDKGALSSVENTQKVLEAKGVDNLEEVAKLNNETFKKKKARIDIENNSAITSSGKQIKFRTSRTTDSEGLNFITITAFDNNSKKVGYARFLDNGKNNLEGNEVEVNDKLQKQGIASAIYSYAYAKGFKVKESILQTPEGRSLWKSLNRKESSSRSIAESYHKAKEDGSNPELVKAVEKLISNENKGTKEEASIPIQPNGVNQNKNTHETENAKSDGKQAAAAGKAESNAPHGDEAGNGQPGSDIPRPAKDQQNTGEGKQQSDKSEQQVVTIAKDLDGNFHVIRKDSPINIVFSTREKADAFAERKGYGVKEGGNLDYSEKGAIKSDTKEIEVNSVSDVLKKLENTDNYTIEDAVKDVEGIASEHSSSEKLDKAVEKFRKEQEYDNSVSGRGDMDSARADLEKVLGEVAAKEGAKDKVSEPVVDHKAGDVLRKFAAVIEKGKISKLGGFKSSTGFDAVWDGSLSVVATALKGGAKLVDAVEAGLAHIRETDWYKSLKDKRGFDEDYRLHISLRGIPKEKLESLAEKTGDVYHASNSKLSEFDPKFTKMDYGHYLSVDPTTSEGYGEYLHVVKLKRGMENYLDMEAPASKEVLEKLGLNKDLKLSGEEALLKARGKYKSDISPEKFAESKGFKGESFPSQKQLTAYDPSLLEIKRVGGYSEMLAESVQEAYKRDLADGLRSPLVKEVDAAIGKPDAKAGDVFRKFADVLGKGKINKLGGFRAGTGFDAVWDASLTVVSETLKATGKLADAIEAGLNHIKESDWYKNLNNKKEFEDKYRDHLAGEFASFEKKGTVGDTESTGIKNKITEEERANQGKEKIKSTGDGTMESAEKTKAKIESGEISEEHIRDLTQTLALGGKLETDLTPVEQQHVLLFDRQKLSNQRQEIYTQQAEARDKGDAAATERLALKEAQNDLLMEANDKAAVMTGRSWSDVGRARQLIMKSDYSFEALKRRYQAKGDGTMSKEVESKFRDISKQLEDANLKLADVEKAKADADAEVNRLKDFVEEVKKSREAQNQNADMFEEVKNEVKKNMRASGKRTIEKIKFERESIKASLKSKWKNHIQGSAGMNNIIPLDMVPDLIKLAKSYIEEGLQVGKDAVLDKIIDRVHRDVVDALENDQVTKTDVRDAITGYGKIKKPSTDPVEKAFQDIAAQGRLVSSIELAQKGEPPLKSGQQRDKPSAEQRRLQKELNKEIKDNNIQVKSPEEQLKTSLDGAKTRLKNQIEDIQDAIDRNEKIKKDRKGIDYDQEAIDLKAQRDELRKEYDELFSTKNELTEEDRLERATKAVQKGIDKLTERIDNKDFSKTPKDELTNQNLEVLKKQRDKLRETYNDLMKTEGEWNKRKLDAMKQHMNLREKELKEIQSSDDLDKYLAKREVRKSNKTVLDADATHQKARIKKLKNHVDEMIYQREFAGRHPLAKGLYYAGRAAKGILISNPIILMRIIGSVAGRAVYKAPTAAFGYLGTKLGGERARGALTEAIVSRKDLADHLAKYYSTLFSRANFEGMKFAAKNHETIEDLAFSEKNYKNIPIPSIKITDTKTAIQASFFATLKVLDRNAALHGALKSLASKPEFEAYKVTIMRNLIREGITPEEFKKPELMEVVEQMALQKSLRAKFMQENFVSGGQKRLEDYLREKGKPELAEVLSGILPITKISSNYISEALTKMPVVGMAAAYKPIVKMLASALGKESKLNLQDKNVLLRTFALQGTGALSYVLGYMLYSSFQPFYKSSAKQYSEDKNPEAENNPYLTAFETLSHFPDALLFTAGVSNGWVWDKYDAENPAEEDKGMGVFMKNMMGSFMDGSLDIASSSPYLSTPNTTLGPLLSKNGDVGKAAANFVKARMPLSTTLSEISQGKIPFAGKLGFKSGNEEKVKPYQVGISPKGFMDNIKWGLPGYRQEVEKRLFDEKYNSDKIKQTDKEKYDAKVKAADKKDLKNQFEEQLNNQ